MMENNLGSLSYSLNIDLDKDVVAKIEKQLENIDLVNKVGISVDSKHLVEEIQKALSGQGFKIKLDVEGLEDAKSKLAGGQTGISGEKQVYEDILRLIQESNLASNEKAEQIAIEQIELAKLKVAREQSNAAEKAGTLSTEDAIRLKGQIIEKEAQHKIALAGLNSELRNEVKNNVAVEGSMDQLSQQLVKMKAEFKAMAPAIRDGSIGQALNKEIQSVDSSLKTLDASIGNYQRNVGDYASGMYGLTYSIQQVARELPNIAISPQMFIMAISNNLPILQDELRRASMAYKALNEEHKIGLNLNKEAVPVWKQITNSIFSWQTVLVAAITIGTVFGKQIFDWIGNLSGLNKSLKSTAKIQDEVNEAMSKSSSDIGKNIVTLKNLQDKWSDLGNNLKEKQKFINDNKESFDSLGFAITGVKDAENLLITNTSAFLSAMKLRAQAVAAQDLAAKKYEEAIAKEADANKTIAEEIKKYTDYSYDAVVGSKYVEENGRQVQVWITKAEYLKNLGEKLKGEYQSLNKEADQFFDLGSERYTQAADILKAAGGKLLTKEPKKSPEKDVNTEKYVNTEKQDRQRERDATDTQYAIDQAEIDAMEEGTDKKLAQMELENKRELDMLNRKREDQIQKIKDNARAIFNADPKNKGKNFDDSTVSLSPEEELGYSRLRNVTLARQEAEKDKSYLDLLKKYQDYTTKRLEIERKFNEDIKLLESKRTEDNSVEIDNAITQRTKERDEDFSSSLMDEFKESDDWIKMFEDLDRLSDETISNLIERFEEFKESEGKNLAPTELKELTKSIEKLRAVSEKRNPFLAISNGFKDLKKAIGGNDKDAMADAFETIENGADAAFDTVEELTEILGELPSQIVDSAKTVTSSTIGMIKDITTLADWSVRATQLSAEGASEAIIALEKASVILAVISAAMQVVSTISHLFRGKSKAEKDTERLNKITKQIEGTNEAINKHLEKRIELIEEATAAEAKYLNQLSQEEIKTQQNYIIQQLDRLSGTEIFGKKGKNNDLDLDELMDMMGLTTYQEFIDWWNDGGYQELIAEGYTFTNKDDWQAIIDDWNDLTDAAEESTEAMQEAATGITFDSLKDSFDALVQDADTTFSDISDSFEDHMSDAIMNMVKSSYLTDALQKWYDQFVDAASDDNLTSDEVASLQDMYNSIYKEAQDMYDTAMAAAGIDTSSSDESALSQAIQGIQESNPGLIEAYLNTIRDGVISGNITGENTLSVLQASQHIQSQSLSELQAINSNTLAMVNAFKSVIASSKQDTGGSLLRVTVI